MLAAEGGGELVPFVVALFASVTHGVGVGDGVGDAPGSGRDGSGMGSDTLGIGNGSEGSGFGHLEDFLFEPLLPDAEPVPGEGSLGSPVMIGTMQFLPVDGVDAIRS